MTTANNQSALFWCKTCLNMSTRPRIEFDDQGRCNACQWAEEKKTFDWSSRMLELKSLLEKHRSKTGEFDVVVPVSGGKDGSYVSYMLKHEFGMHPLAVTITPPLSFSIGDQNLQNYIASGYDTIQINPNQKVMQELNRRGFLEQGRPLYGWVVAILAGVIRTAANFGVNLVMYGEDGEIEYGGSTESKNRPVFTAEFMKRVYLEGQYEKTLRDLSSQQTYFWRFDADDQKLGNIECAHFSYFESWDPYRNYMIAKEHCGLQEKEESNTGTYTNFAQNDTCLYDLHTYLMYLKFGFGRATQDAGIDIRRGAMSRDQGVMLAQMYDNCYPEPFIEKYLDYYKISRELFDKTIDNFANKDLFYKDGDRWMPKFEII
ncbi:N-acetyl sugar amidotransferase [Thalassolituus alkanivorans]|uniref:N-acetyl sugar amidotransferase n=1 Tax=Thalassolituus alkanivorans TaxID=2881055 RepID=UPI000C37B6A6|nr:N-acetyl sugar amidotransferase [Thalassolituus alkanivorans]MAY14342.1 legionaminic acid biosynthesis protein PtmG [Oceanospirillaceae bacterium]MCB2385257.1 N-acetyl sugar amidotransferase [Thalassolituus alkanivorans]MCB2421886.1 N-acetyl sugar amidotransferase [Thalassolituus alkanivorans]